MFRGFTAWERGLAALAFILGIILFGGGVNLPEVSARESRGRDIFSELKVFTDVLSLVKRDYVSEVPDKQLIEGAIKGMLASLDPHSGYLDPDFYQDLQVQTKGEFGGLGIEITIKDGLLVVVAPMEGSPAEKAGIRAGDAIIKIEGKFTKEFTLVDAVKRLRGPRGTPINISIQREGVRKLINITVIRDDIKVKSVRSRYLGEGYAYVRVGQFMEKTADDLKTALNALRRENGNKELSGLILDLRNDPGGLLTQAVKVADLFLKEGVIVYTDGRVESQKQKFYAHPRGTEADYPIVVLVNSGSASASEIVAGALQDHGRALILGTQTFGKGSVQTITPLENGGALTLTTALYYTASGRSLQGSGVKPDIVMEEPKIKVRGSQGVQRRLLQYRESDLEGAIANPDESGEESGKQGIEQDDEEREDLTSAEIYKLDQKSWLERDPLVARALELLKTFNVFKTFKP